MRHCSYCGHRCQGRTCQYHSDLPRLEPSAALTMRAELADTARSRPQLPRTRDKRGRFRLAI